MHELKQYRRKIRHEYMSYVQHVYLRLPLQVEFPPLAAYRLEFGEPEPDPEEVQNDTVQFITTVSLKVYSFYSFVRLNFSCELRRQKLCCKIHYSYTS